MMANPPPENPTAAVPLRESELGPTITGDLFVSSIGSPGQLPPDIAAIARQARLAVPPRRDSDPRGFDPVTVHADFSSDGRYLGYTVEIQLGPTKYIFEVTGAASRFIPVDEFHRMGEAGAENLRDIEEAEKSDAHAKSGVFGGGLTPTASQSKQRHTQRRPRNDRTRR